MRQLREYALDIAALAKLRELQLKKRVGRSTIFVCAINFRVAVNFELTKVRLDRISFLSARQANRFFARTSKERLSILIKPVYFACG